MAGELLPRQQYAACKCGCGQTPPIARRTYTYKNIRQGEPLNIVPGHQGRFPRPLPVQDPNPSGRCQCGCGQETTIAQHTNPKRQEYRGRHRRFAHGHWLKVHRYELPQHQGPRGWRRRIAAAMRLLFPERTQRELPARPPRRMLEARPLVVRQREAIQQSGRSLCLSCFEPRPNVAFLNGTKVCLVCVVRARKTAAVDQQHQDHERQKTQHRKTAHAKALATMQQRGTSTRRNGVPIVLNRKRTR